MSATSHGLRAVKLTEIPLEDRLKAAHYAARHLCHDGAGTEEVLAAALCPSDKTYWVREQAAAEVELLAAA